MVHLGQKVNLIELKTDSMLRNKANRYAMRRFRESKMAIAPNEPAIEQILELKKAAQMRMVHLDH